MKKMHKKVNSKSQKQKTGSKDCRLHIDCWL